MKAEEEMQKLQYSMSQHMSSVFKAQFLEKLNSLNSVFPVVLELTLLQIQITVPGSCFSLKA